MTFEELLSFAGSERQRILSYYSQGEKLPDSRTEILAYGVKLTEEVGELSNALLAHLSLQRKSKLEKIDPENLSDEIADVILSSLIIADAINVDVVRALSKKIDKIKERTSKPNH